jgi:hypothetical protein
MEILTPLSAPLHPYVLSQGVQGTFRVLKYPYLGVFQKNVHFLTTGTRKNQI